MNAVYRQEDLFLPDIDPKWPGKTVITVDGSDKGGVSFTSVALRARWCKLGHSQYAVHPVAIGKCKEKNIPLQHMPLQCLLSQSR